MSATNGSEGHGAMAMSVSEALERWDGLEPASRETWLAELATTQPAVAAEVASLSRYVRGDDGLDRATGPLVMTVASGRMPVVGEMVGEYALVAKIGAGGFGVVFEGRAGARRAAIKVLRESLEATTARERFAAEARILASLEHPGIAKLIETGTCNGLPYMVQQLVSGSDVRTFCAERGVDGAGRVRLVCDALEALAHAHEKRVVHRDIKPQNVMVTQDGRVCLIDFGIARHGAGLGVTRTGQRVGTTAYMSPEQLDGEKEVSAAADVYAMGVLLYELLTGHLPYDAVMLAEEPERAIREGRVVAMSVRAGAACDGVSPSVEDVIARALRKEPSDRYRDAGAFAAALRAALAGMRPEGVWSKGAYAVRVWGRKYGAWAASAAIAAGAAGWMMADRAQTQEAKSALAARVSSAEYVDAMRAVTTAITNKDSVAARKTLEGVPSDARGPEWGWMASLADPSPVLKQFGHSIMHVARHRDGMVATVGLGELVMVDRAGKTLWEAKTRGVIVGLSIMQRADGDLVVSCDTEGVYLHRAADGVEVEHAAKETAGVSDVAVVGEGMVLGTATELMYAEMALPARTLVGLPAGMVSNSVAADTQTGVVVLSTRCEKRVCQEAALIAGRVVGGKWEPLWTTMVTRNGAHALVFVQHPTTGRRVVVGCSLDKSVFVHDLLTGEALEPMPNLPAGAWGADVKSDGETIAVGTIRGEVAIAKLGDAGWQHARRHRNYARVAWDGDVVVSGGWDGSLRNDDPVVRDSSGLVPTGMPVAAAFGDGPVAATWVSGDGTQYVMRATGERSEFAASEDVSAVAIWGETVWTGDRHGRVTRVERDGSGLEQTMPHAVHNMVVAHRETGPVLFAFDARTGMCSVVDGATLRVLHTVQTGLRDGMSHVGVAEGASATAVSISGSVTRVGPDGNVREMAKGGVRGGVLWMREGRVLLAECARDPAELVVFESGGEEKMRVQLGAYATTQPRFTSDGSRCVIGTDAGSVVVVGMAEGKVIATLPVSEERLLGVHVTSDGRLLSLDAKGVVRQIDGSGQTTREVAWSGEMHASEPLESAGEAGVRVMAAAWGGEDEAREADPAAGDVPDLSGIEPLGLTGAPGPVVVMGEARSLIDGPDGSGSVLAMTTFGRGAVVAFAHGGYLGEANIREDAQLRECMRRVVAWAQARDEGSAIALGGAGKGVMAALAKDGVWRTEDRGWREALAGRGVVIVDSHQFTQAGDAAKVRGFVERGGTLITSGLAWGWLQLNPGKTITQHPGNVALAEMGLAFGDGTLDGDEQNRYPVRAREHARGRDDMDVIARVRRGERGLDKARVSGAVARTRIALRTLTPEQERAVIGLDAMLADGADAVAASFASMREQGLRADRDPLALLACERYAGEEFGKPASEVKAHPSAAAFPGLVEASAERGARTVEVDTTLPGWRATGMFVPAGELVRVSIDEALAEKGLRLQVGSHLDPALRAPLRRLPVVTREFAVSGPTTEVASAVGGLLYLVVPEGFAEKSVRATISGAVRAPHFVLGQTTQEAWREEIRLAPGTWGEIESREIALTVPSDLLRTLDDPGELLELWDRIVRAQGSLEPRRKNGLGDRQARYVPDVHVSWGYMYAPADRPLTIPMSAAKNLIDAKMLSTNSDGDAWGLFHEMGHWHQNSMWTFDGTGEVTVNIFTLYTIETICGLPPAQARGDVFTHEKMLDTMRRHVARGSSFDAWKRDPFLALTMYVQLQQAFGWEAYREVFARYRGLAQEARPDDDEEKRDRWMEMMSEQVGRDLGGFFEAWGVPVRESARARTAHLPAWMPEGWSDPRVAPAGK